MILRSLTKHVKDQNWVAVGLDFAIVVIGVFIGIQVANWNDLRAERAQTERMLSDLMIDLKEMREVAAYQSDRYLESAKLTDAILDSLDAGDGTKPNKMAETFNLILFAHVPPPLPGGLDQLLVAGRLDLLADAPLRAALNELLVRSSLAATGSTELFNEFRWADLSVRPYLSVSRAPEFDYREDEYEVVTAVDIEALRSDAKARLALGRLYAFHANMRGLSQMTEDSIATVLGAVADGGY